MPRSLLALSVTACAALFASGGLARPVHAGSPPPGTNQYRLCHGPRGERRAGRRSRRRPTSPSRRTARTATSCGRSSRASRCRSPSSSTTTAPASSARASSASCSYCRAGPTISLSSVVGQTQKLVDYTTDVQKLTAAIVGLSRPAGHARWRPAARRHLPDGEGSGEARGDASGDRGGHGRRRGTQHASGAPRPRPARQERQHACM